MKIFIQFSVMFHEISVTCIVFFLQILDEKVDFSEKVNSKIGSLDKIKHQPGGGDVKVSHRSIHSNSQNRMVSISELFFINPYPHTLHSLMPLQQANFENIVGKSRKHFLCFVGKIRL